VNKRNLTPGLGILAVVGAIYLGRARLGRTLTRRTGTWVGSPS
jgi:hypothetical protein